MVNGDGLDDLRELMSFATTTSPVSSSTRVTRSTKVRDSQRSKVYAAERAVRPTLDGLGPRWETIDEMQAYADKLIASAWFKRRWSYVRGVTIRPGYGRRRGGCDLSHYWPVIAMPRWTRTEWYLLHEMAHAVTNVEQRAGHGPEFVSTFLVLVRHQLGDEAWRLLRQSFLDHKVRIKRPSKTKRKLTPEQRAAAVERLAKARAAKNAKS